MVEDLARPTLERARDHLLGLQHAEGWWQGELETNVTMDAEDLLLREFLGVHDDAVISTAARWIRSQQRDDGTWANFYGGPADLSTTVEAYLALKLAGDEPDAPHMKLARDWIRARGGGGGAAYEAGRVLDPGAGRGRGEPRVHPDLAGPVRPVVVGRPAGHPARADLPAVLVSAQHLRLGLLGAADHRRARRAPVVPTLPPHRPVHRRAEDRRPPWPGSPPAPRPRRAARRRHDQRRGPLVPLLQRPRHDPAGSRPVLPPPPSPRLPAGKVDPASGAAALRRVDHRPAGEGRLLGRHPATLGVLADGAEPAGLRNLAPHRATRAERS